MFGKRPANWKGGISLKPNYRSSWERTSVVRKLWREKNKELLKEMGARYYQKNKKKIADCNKKYYIANKEKVNLRNRFRANERRNELRKNVFKHYGGNPPKCACCGEIERKFLTLDHINGGGAGHRRKLKRMSGVAMYLWAEKNNYPKIFQVLCMNCNFAKGSNGLCPHKNEKNKIK